MFSGGWDPAAPSALDLAPTSDKLPAEVGGAGGQMGGGQEREERRRGSTPGLAGRASPRAHLRIIWWPLCDNCQLLLLFFFKFYSFFIK